MNESYMDDILMALGGLDVKRKMRKEDEQFVEIAIRSQEYPQSEYILTWRTGNVLDISTHTLHDNYVIKIARIYMSADGLYFGRELTVMIYGIIVGYDKVLKFGA